MHDIDANSNKADGQSGSYM